MISVFLAEHVKEQAKGKYPAACFRQKKDIPNAVHTI